MVDGLLVPPGSPRNADTDAITLRKDGDLAAFQSIRHLLSPSSTSLAATATNERAREREQRLVGTLSAGPLSSLRIHVRRSDTVPQAKEETPPLTSVSALRPREIYRTAKPLRQLCVDGWRTDELRGSYFSSVGCDASYPITFSGWAAPLRFADGMRKAIYRPYSSTRWTSRMRAEGVGPYRSHRCSPYTYERR